MHLDFVEDLTTLATDAAARGYESMSTSVYGVIDMLRHGDMTNAALAHDEWMRALGTDWQLSRMLGPCDSYHAECAFAAAVMMRVIVTIDRWMTDAAATVEKDA